LDEELEQIEQALEDTESDELLDQQQVTRERLDEVDEKLAAHVGFDAGHKTLAGCYVSIGQDGKLFMGKGLVKPEHRKEFERLLRNDDGKPDAGPSKPKNPLSESLRRDLAASRLEAAQVEIASHPAIAFDLLVFQVASVMLHNTECLDGPDVEFTRPRPKTEGTEEPSTAAAAFKAMGQSLPTGWRKLKSEPARFEEFRLLPETAKLELLAYCVAL